MKVPPAVNSCIWQRVPPCFRPSRASRGRKLIRRDRYGSLFLFQPVGAYDAVGRPWADKMKHLPRHGGG